MKIIKTYNWNRRDFSFNAECEHCKAIQTNIGGYDDANYYQNVIPEMSCKSCGKKSKDLPQYETLTTRYNPSLTL